MQQQQITSTPLAARSSRQTLRINTSGLRPMQMAAIPVASPTASPSASTSTSPSAPGGASTSFPAMSPLTTPPLPSPLHPSSPKLGSFARLPAQRPLMPGFVKASLYQPTPSALLRAQGQPSSRSGVYALHSSQLMSPPSSFRAAFPFASPSTLTCSAAEAAQLTCHYPNPSTALLSLSSILSSAAAQTPAPAVAGTAAQLMPHRPQEGETSRFGAMGMDSLCPALLFKSAARMVWPHLRRSRGEDEE